MVRYRHSPGAPTSCRSFRLSRRCRPTRCTLHRCSRLSHYPPFLTHSISNPFLIRTAQMRVLSPSPTPFEFRGTPCFPLTPSVSWLRGRERETKGCAPVLSAEWGGRGRKGAEALTSAVRMRPRIRPPTGPEMRPIRERILGRICGPLGGRFRARKGAPAIDCGADFRPSRAPTRLHSLLASELRSPCRISRSVLVWPTYSSDANRRTGCPVLQPTGNTAACNDAAARPASARRRQPAPHPVVDVAVVQ